MEICCSRCQNIDAFKFTPYRKKPSERILELSSGKLFHVNDPLNARERMCADYASKVDGILNYLDEQFEKAQK